LAAIERKIEKKGNNAFPKYGQDGNTSPIKEDPAAVHK
jgi:hypothetical protein